MRPYRAVFNKMCCTSVVLYCSVGWLYSIRLSYQYMVGTHTQSAMAAPLLVSPVHNCAYQVSSLVSKTVREDHKCRSCTFLQSFHILPYCYRVESDMGSEMYIQPTSIMCI